MMERAYTAEPAIADGRIAATDATPACRPVALRRDKRLFDITGAMLLILLFAPLLLILYALVRLDGGPGFYRHRRIGAGGRSFDCLKFRSMRTDANAVLQRLLAEDERAAAEWAAHFKLKNDPRITPVGRFLRKSSLDELPQLFNVVAGDMSLVGPRPIVEAEKPYYREYLQHYKSCRPGMTGLWQVSGRSDVGYGERVALDARYVERWSLALDITILARTPVAVVAGSGAY